jgi:predicted transcriptional regulator
MTKTLDFSAPARRRDPATSHVAAASVQRKVRPQVLRLLELIRQHPDRTAGELAAASLGELDFHTVCRRVSALERADLIDVNDVGRECSVRGTVQRTYRVKETS